MRVLLAILILLFLCATPVHATENPTAVPNNKYGIHIVNENDLDKARQLVNSGGGDWGYVKVVIQESERSRERWQAVFNKMRDYHVIPIVRVATRPVEAGWAIPNPDETNGWLDFFDSLNWVTQNRYVIIGNEPNQNHEWGGAANAREYADYLENFSSKLKARNPDYFVLSAGFDTLAPNGKTTINEANFLSDMLTYKPNVFTSVDGWSSHSYPNLKDDVTNQFGRGSLRTYEWELNYLKSLGVNKEFPVFITETGWRHDGDGKFVNPPDYKYAAEHIWNDDRLVAITPFLLNYSGDPFLEFSWIDRSGKPYGFYYDYSDIHKKKGDPTQITSGAILGNLYFPLVQANHGIYGVALVENTGQSVWEAGKYSLSPGQLITWVDIKPFQTKLLFYKIQSPNRSQLFNPILRLVRSGKEFGVGSQIFVRVIKFLFFL